MVNHARDLETQDRLTKNIKDLLWLHAWDRSGKGSDPSEALKELQVGDLSHENASFDRLECGDR